MSTERPTGCIDADELVAMVEGTLADDRREAVLAHVDGCAVCAEVVANLGSFEETERRVGRYQLERVLGAGAMGIVYRAWDPQLRRRVAVKLVRPERSNPTSHARMLREARALARIAHPNVVAVHDAGDHAGEIFVTTEFVDGETLETWIAGRPRHEILAAWIQIARGLGAAHAEGVVHRDVKPTNAFMGHDGRARIGDFGLARQGAIAVESDVATPIDSGTKLSMAGGLAGTPAYMAPEQWTGVADARSDQFSLCVAIVEALTGARPSAGDRVDLEPAPLAAALTRGLSEVPEARFESVDALADALERAVTPPRSRGRWAIVAVALAAVTVGSVGAWFALRSPAAACEIATIPDDLVTPARRAALGAIGAPRVDHWSASWNAAASDVCSSSTDASLRERRQRCLASALAEMRTVLEQRWDGQPIDTSAYIAIEEVTRPTRCSADAVRASLEPSLAQLPAIIALRAAAAIATTQAEIEQLVQRAQLVAHPPLTVELLLELAAYQMQDRPAYLRTAHAALAAARDDYSFATATNAVLAQLGADDGEHAKRLADAARPRIIALGDPMLEAILDAYLGQIASTRNQSDEAIAAFERARRSFQFALGPESLHEATVLVQLAGVYRTRDLRSAKGTELFDAGNAIFRAAGRPLMSPSANDPSALAEQALRGIEEATASGDRKLLARTEFIAGAVFLINDQSEAALGHYQRAAALFSELPVRDSQHASALSSSAEILTDLGRAKDAVPLAREAVRIAEELHVDAELATALRVLGGALIATGKHAAAREPLQRALKLHNRLNEPGRVRGGTLFLLATALWQVDRKRARSLAHAARIETESALEELAPTDPTRAYVRRHLEARLAQIERLISSR